MTAKGSGGYGHVWILLGLLLLCAVILTFAEMGLDALVSAQSLTPPHLGQHARPASVQEGATGRGPMPS